MSESQVNFLLGVLLTILLVVIGDALDRAKRARIQRIGAERIETAIGTPIDRLIPTEDVEDFYEGIVPAGRVAVGPGGVLYQPGEVVK